MSKTADLDTISIQFFYIYMCYVYGWWLLSKGGGAASFQGGGRVLLAPSLNETLRQYLTAGNFGHHPLALEKFLSHNLCPVHVDDYTENITTFAASAKINSNKHFFNSKVAGIGTDFGPAKTSSYTVY